MIIRMKNIQWDTWNSLRADLPTNVDFLVVDESLSIDDQKDQAMSFASDQTGWCVDSCDFEVVSETSETES